MNKKAQMPVEAVIFIFLNILFFGVLLYFVISASSGALVFEKIYSKQIALLIDESKPGTVLNLNIEQGYEIAEENQVGFENAFLFKENFVGVKLGSSDAYKYPYFNDVEIEKTFEISENEKKLILEVK